MENQSLQCYQLNNGFKIPKVGLGTYLSKDPEALTKVIKEAYKIGYRHFDTAQLYDNEKSLGKAFEALFNDGIKREEIFITTKTFIFKGESIEEKLKESLKKLKLDYVDLYLIHWSFTDPKIENNELILQHMPVHQAWREMEKCVEIKLTKSIGVSNFNVQSIMNLLSYCKIKPVVNQIELHPYLTQEGLLDCCERFHIQVTAYSPLARNSIDLFEQPILKSISEKYKKSPAQICLRYLIEKKVSIIPKTEKVERLKENFDLFWEGGLSLEDIKQLDTLNKNMRIVETKLAASWQYIDAFA